MGSSQRGNQTTSEEMAEMEQSKTASWSRPLSRMYQYNRDGVGTTGELKHPISQQEQKQRVSNVEEEGFEGRNMDTESENSTPSSSSNSTMSVSDGDVDDFLLRSYAQQIKERNIVKVHEIGVRSGVSRFSGPVTPIISPATNIRNYCVRSVASFR